MTQNRRVLLKSRPVGRPEPSDFEIVDRPVPDPPAGGVVTRNAFISMDPAIRGWMDDRESYMPPIPLGEAVRATVAGHVVKSANPGFAEGDAVVGLGGWETHSAMPGEGFTAKVDPAIVPSLTAYLSVLGAVGMTSYFGTVDVLDPQPGETVLVSAAAGAVGSLVGQIAKLKGAHAIGIAGGPDKCRVLTEAFGFDGSVDYKAFDGLEPLAAAIASAAPDRIDCHFENVGGTVMDAALLNLADKARVALCGMIAVYNERDPMQTAGQKAIWQLIVRKARIQGFLVSEYLDRFEEGIGQMAQWVSEGKLVYKEEVVEGIDNALPAFNTLFDGTNTGKVILKVED